MILAMEDDVYRKMSELKDGELWRRKCGCLRTSDKLKRMLASFPPPPPPTPTPTPVPTCVPLQETLKNTCISVYCTRDHNTCPSADVPRAEPVPQFGDEEDTTKGTCKVWRVIGEFIHLLQLSVTATALALYYVIYCYMQLIYYALRSALYFHNADGSAFVQQWTCGSDAMPSDRKRLLRAMKLTIGVVVLTSLFVAFNLILKIEKMIWVYK